MPSIEKHIELSLKRTGEEYREVHEWMDEEDTSYKERIAKHRIYNIPRFFPIVKKKFGKGGAKEYIKHVRDDYENNILLRARRILERLIGHNKKSKKALRN